MQSGYFIVDKRLDKLKAISDHVDVFVLEIAVDTLNERAWIQWGINSMGYEFNDS